MDQCETMMAQALKEPSFAALKEGVKQKLRLQCRSCKKDGVEGQARAYLSGPNPVGVTLCANRLHSFLEAEEALRHEMIHAFDLCTTRLDLRKCHPLAYSEVGSITARDPPYRHPSCLRLTDVPLSQIRAAREAECRNITSAEQLHQCIRAHAVEATRTFYPRKGEACVAEMFERAMADFAPMRVSQPIAAISPKR